MSEHLKQRPENCRNALQERGEPYPRSGCAVCGNGGTAGCPYDRQDAAALELKVKQLEAERAALVEQLGKAERLAEYESESFRILCHAIQRLEEIVGIDTGGFNGPGPAIGEVERIVKERDALAGDLDRLRKAAFEVCNDWCSTHESASRPVFDAMLESTGNRTPDGKPIDWLAEAALGLKPKESTE